MPTATSYNWIFCGWITARHAPEVPVMPTRVRLDFRAPGVPKEVNSAMHMIGYTTVAAWIISSRKSDT